MSRCLISTVYHLKSLSVHDPPHPSFLSQKSEFLFTPGLTPFLHWLIVLCSGHCARSWGEASNGTQRNNPCPYGMSMLMGRPGRKCTMIQQNNYSSNSCLGRSKQGGDREQEGEPQWITRSGRSLLSRCPLGRGWRRRESWPVPIQMTRVRRGCWAQVVLSWWTRVRSSYCALSAKER